MYFVRSCAPVHCALMRRIFSYLIAGIATLVVVSCIPRSNISAEEVLRRTIIRSHTLDSANLTATVSAQLNGKKAMSGSALIEGVIQNGGLSWSLVSSVRVRGLLPNDQSSGNVSLLTPDGQVYYVHFDTIQGAATAVVPLIGTGSANGWWKTGTSLPVQAYTRTIPSPSELEQAVSLFTIVDFSSPRRGADGRLQYRLTVSLADDAMQSLFGQYVSEETRTTGTLTIDALDFSLRRTQWSLESLQTSEGSLNLAFDITLKDFDTAAEVVLPTGSSATLPLKDIFATFSH